MTLPGIVHKELYGKGKGMDAVFKADGTFNRVTSSGFELVYHYKFKAPDTLFQSYDGTTFNDYLLLNFPGNKRLVMIDHLQGGRSHYFHFTAE